MNFGAITSVLNFLRTAGNIGVSPAAGTALTGFSLVLSALGTSASSTQVTGQLMAASYKSPTPSQLLTAIANMQTAYTDAAGRVNPNFNNLGSGMFHLV